LLINLCNKIKRPLLSGHKHTKMFLSIRLDATSN